MRVKVCGAHKYWMDVWTVKGPLEPQQGAAKMSPGPLFDCVLSKYSSLLSVLHFKPFQAAPPLSIFTLVSTKGSSKIE